MKKLSFIITFNTFCQKLVSVTVVDDIFGKREHR